MFRKILIANRGEIACRIIKTAKAMGIQTVAVYSSADKEALHVSLADEAHCIGEASAKQSYLNIPAIINAAKATGSEAIHPGYGFLSENTAFAKACHEANITFIGPTIEAMEAMASKQLAKQLLEHTTVPLTPGYHGTDQSDAKLFSEAKRIGFPVLLKAAAGGGGKGMRAVHQEDEFQVALDGARREAKSSFADDTMIIEKLILHPRHIEIQIMADAHGHVIHLFERDCSIQRRHQKIIEEAPAPHLNDTIRQRMAHAAVEAAKKIAYLGAGTVEFLLSDEHTFYFMEMNTRLQVEHPVTECITGLDLVAWQLKIAAGEPLPLKQEDIHATGHAIECRIYAEDPDQHFMPSIGQLHFYREPHGAHVRVDSGVSTGSAISMHYDPMLAKLIAYGETRELAQRTLSQALKAFAIGGVKTNVPFLQAIIEHPAFVHAELSTDFLQKHHLKPPKIDETLALCYAAALHYHEVHAQSHGLSQEAFAWQMHLPSTWAFRRVIQNTLHMARIEPLTPDTFFIRLSPDDVRQVKWLSLGDTLNVEIDGQLHHVMVEKAHQTLYCYIDGHCITINDDAFEDAFQEGHGDKSALIAPMPATVVAVLKQRGDKVNQGDRLIVLEAMKMEHTIHAPRNGTLKELFYEVGQQVSEGAPLLALED